MTNIFSTSSIIVLSVHTYGARWGDADSSRTSKLQVCAGGRREVDPLRHIYIYIYGLVQSRSVCVDAMIKRGERTNGQETQNGYHVYQSHNNIPTATVE